MLQSSSSASTPTTTSVRNRDSNLTRLVVVLLWAVLAIVQIQRLSADPALCGPSSDECQVSNPAPDCSCHQYLNSSTGRCEDCRNCCQEGKYTASECLSDLDAVCSPCVPGLQFYDTTAAVCRNCTVCASDETKITACTTEQDTHCLPKCLGKQYVYVADLDRCIFNCELCPHGCTTSDKCRCQPSQCYLEHDLLCENNQCSTSETPPSEVTGTVDDRSNDLPTWGIGLISIGVVIGIVAFSAGSMILSFCTRKSPQADPEMNEPGVNSKPPMGHYPGNQPGALFHKHRPLFEASRKYGHCSPGSSTRSSSVRSGSIRTNSIRNSPKTHGVIFHSPRTDKSTPI